MEFFDIFKNVFFGYLAVLIGVGFFIWENNKSSKRNNMHRETMRRLDELNNEISLLKNDIHTLSKKLAPTETVTAKPASEEQPATQTQEPLQEHFVHDTPSKTPSVENAQTSPWQPKPQAQSQQMQAKQPAIQGQPFVASTHPAANKQLSQKPQKPSFRERHKLSFETFVGKNLMGILASVLVFIGLIFVASLALPYMTDTIKMIAMFAVSGIILAGGIFGTRKSKSILYEIMTGCGFGAFFVSIFASKFILGFFSDIFLYALLMLWAIIVAIYGKKKSIGFQIVGQLGILVSFFPLFFGTQNQNMLMKTLLPMIYLTVSESAFVIAAKLENTKKTKMVAYISAAVMSLLSVVFVPNYITDLYQKSSGFNLIGLGANLVHYAGFYTLMLLLLNEIEPKADDGKQYRVFYYAAIAVTALSAIIGCAPFIEALRPVMLLPILIYAIYAVYKKDMLASGKDYEVLKAVTVTALLACLGRLTHTYPVLDGVFAVAIVALMAFAYKSKDKLYQYAVLCLYLLFIVTTRFGYYEWVSRSSMFYRTNREHLVYPVCIIGMLAQVIAVAYLYWAERANTGESKFSEISKLCVYFISVCLALTINSLCNRIWPELAFGASIELVLITFIHLLIIRLDFFRCMASSREKYGAMFIVSSIINVLAMILCLVEIHWAESTICFIIVIFAAVALFMLNLLWIIKRYKPYGGYYVGLKLTILVYSVVGELISDEAVILSGVMLIAAIMFIFLGFKFKEKSIRQYGLVLSLISTAKLILGDIRYTSSLTRAVGYIICGLICFAISMLYNRLSKSDEQDVKKDDDNIKDNI